MSKLENTKHISVLNYNENCVCIKISPDRSVKLEPASGNEPFLLPLTLDEIKFANNGNVFKTGILEFAPDVEDAVYEELRIDKTNMLKLKDIRNILMSPTKDGLNKIVSMSSLADFDRVRGQFQKLKSEGYKLTLDIANIIEQRTKELFNSQVKTGIQISDADSVQSNERVVELEQEIASMKELLAEFMGKQQNGVQDTDKSIAAKATEVSVQDNDNGQEVAVKKKPGRPPKTTG